MSRRRGVVLLGIRPPSVCEDKERREEKRAAGGGAQSAPAPPPPPPRPAPVLPVDARHAHPGLPRKVAPEAVGVAPLVDVVCRAWAVGEGAEAVGGRGRGPGVDPARAAPGMPRWSLVLALHAAPRAPSSSPAPRRSQPAGRPAALTNLLVEHLGALLVDALEVARGLVALVQLAGDGQGVEGGRVRGWACGWGGAGASLPCPAAGGGRMAGACSG